MLSMLLNDELVVLIRLMRPGERRFISLQSATPSLRAEQAFGQHGMALNGASCQRWHMGQQQGNYEEV